MHLTCWWRDDWDDLMMALWWGFVLDLHQIDSSPPMMAECIALPLKFRYYIYFWLIFNKLKLNLFSIFHLIVFQFIRTSIKLCGCSNNAKFYLQCLCFKICLKWIKSIRIQWNVIPISTVEIWSLSD